MKVYLGADHRGYALKNEIAGWLVDRQIPFVDFGAKHYDAEDDFPDYAKLVAKAVRDSNDPKTFGILICGSAQGMAMQANRYKGIRAAICHSPEEAVETRGHNNANILCIAADQDRSRYFQIIEAFMRTLPINDPNYRRRNQKLDED